MAILAILKLAGIIIVAFTCLAAVLSFIKVGPYPDIQESDVKPADRMEDRQAIQFLIDTMVIGWGSGDGKLYASVFTDTCDYIAFNGARYISRLQNEQIHNELFNSVLKGSSLVNQKIISLRFIDDDVAIVISTGCVKTRFVKKPPAGRASIQTLVAKKNNGVWKFTSFQNSRISQFTILDGIKMSFS
jgi:uncharacterized protein (TIGR02246 family)